MREFEKSDHNYFLQFACHVQKFPLTQLLESRTTFWNRIPRECFSYYTLLNFSCLGSTVVYPTYLHNIHFLSPLIFIQKTHFVILCIQCILGLELAEHFSNKNIFGIFFSLAIRNMTEKQIWFIVASLPWENYLVILSFISIRISLRNTEQLEFKS